MATLVSDVITYARQLAQTDSNGITDTLGLAFTNDALQDMTRELIMRDIDASQTQEAYTNATTANPNTYAWPSDMYMLKTVEVDFTGTGGQNYIQAQMLDVANIQGNTSFDYLRVNQPSSSPLIDNRGDTFELFPIPANTVTNGIRIFYYLTPTEYAATTTALSYPQTLDYRALAAKVASLYALSLEKGDLSDKCDKEYRTRLEKMIKILGPGSQQPIHPEALHITGWNF